MNLCLDAMTEIKKKYSFTLCRVVLIAMIFLLFSLYGMAAIAEPVNQFDWWWFLYEKESTQYEKNLTFRPFYTRTDQNISGKSFSASLMPLIFWRYKTTQKDEWRWLFGFGNSLDYIHDDNVPDYDFGFFPFVYYGSSTEKGDNYFMLWPFGGTLRGKLGQKRISAYIFPGFLLFVFFPPWQVVANPIGVYALSIVYLFASFMPLYTDYEFKDYKAWGLVWPILQRGKSSDRDEFRILPFYAHSKKEGWYSNYSILMIFNYRRTFYKDREHKTLFIFPLFGRKWSTNEDVSAFTVLWPFFSWGYNKRIGDTRYNLPWPLVQIQDCKKPYIKKRIFFPFYGSYKYEKNETFFITPLYFTMTRNAKTYRSEYYINCILIWYFKRDYNKIHSYYGNSWRYFKIWPLFHIEYNDLGDYQFQLLSLLPVRDPEGYDRLYQPLWSLFEYRKLRTGERRLGLLLRTYYQRWGDRFFEAKVPILFTYKERNDIIREFSFLLSMFGYSNEEKGKYLKLLWIPVRIADGVPYDDEERKLEEAKLRENLKLAEYSHRAGTIVNISNEFRFSSCLFR